MEVWLMLLALPFIMVGVLSLLNYLESRLVWPYGALESRCHIDDATGYALTTIKHAIENGFEFLGWSRDLKGPMFQQVSYAMLISSDRKTLAIVGIGIVMNQRVGATWLSSTQSDRLRYVLTTDQSGAIEPDVAGIGTCSLLDGVTFHELLQKHQSITNQLHGGVLTMNKGKVLQDFATIRRERYDWLERRSIIRFVDQERSRWKYTLRGAFAVTIQRSVAYIQAVPGIVLGIPRRMMRVANR